MPDNRSPDVTGSAGDNGGKGEGARAYDIHPVVFFGGGGVIVLGVILTLVAGASAENMFDIIHGLITTHTDWVFVLVMNVALLLCIGLIFSRFGRIRLGGEEAKPEFSVWAWFAMLFGAGMGIGILFFSVAEPLIHYSSLHVINPLAEPTALEDARKAMEITFLHWGLHPWGIYALMGLALGFFGFTRGLPLSIRNLFHPLLGERIHGWPGNLIDIVATVATLYGVATSLGLGVQQINAGLNHVFDVPVSTFYQVVLIAAVTLGATWSVLRGLHRGIKLLSQVNLLMAALLMLFVLLLGPTLHVVKGFFQNLGGYAAHLIPLAVDTGYTGSEGAGAWTVFYWGWWIAWSPFVGMFVARVSYGRTIRQYLLGVLFVPALVTFLWMTVFGNSSIYFEIFTDVPLAEVVSESIPVSLFVFLEGFPLQIFMSILATLVVVAFFVTSSDSGSLVIDIITAGGNPNPPKIQRVFWAVLQGVVAAVLLIGGGLAALQTAAITAGFPFAIIILFMCWSLVKGLREYSPGGGEREREK